jgi:adrenodoxin-NADP+ reductase
MFCMSASCGCSYDTICYRNEEFDLEATRAVVIGQGNVALDVARMLLRSTKELQTTDITNTAVKQLSGSKVQEVYINSKVLLTIIHQVHVIGRRGAIQAAFTTKEFRELLALPNVETYPL